MQLLITGCARSGTSLTTQLLQAHGLETGRTNSLFENTDVRERILKPMLESVGGDRLGQHPLPPRDAHPDAHGLSGHVQAVLGDQWAYKDAKLCLVWRAWAEAFPDAKWLIVRRKANDIAASCLRTGFMRAYSTAEGWLGWVDEHLQRFEDMRTALDVREVWPAQWIAGDLDSLRELTEWLGLDFDPTAARKIINPKAWNRK